MFKKENIIKELEKGEKYGFVKNFNRNSFIKEMDLKHSQKKPAKLESKS